MKELIPMNDCGLFCDGRDTARLDSRFVAEAFEKEHKHVLRDIAKITEPKSGLSEEFRRLNFVQSTYKDSTGRTLPRYAMTRDGFTMLVMGYTGPRAMVFKEAYIKRFNEMEAHIAAMVSARHQFPRLTAQIRLLNPEAKPYHYSNECDMLNRLVLGMTAKQFKIEHGIPLETGSIRPWLTQEQIEKLDELQAIDLGLMVAEPDFQQRKMKLEWYLHKQATA